MPLAHKVGCLASLLSLRGRCFVRPNPRDKAFVAPLMYIKPSLSITPRSPVRHPSTGVKASFVAFVFVIAKHHVHPFYKKLACYILWVGRVNFYFHSVYYFATRLASEVLPTNIANEWASLGHAITHCEWEFYIHQ